MAWCQRRKMREENGTEIENEGKVKERRKRTTWQEKEGGEKEIETKENMEEGVREDTKRGNEKDTKRTGGNESTTS